MMLDTQAVRAFLEDSHCEWAEAVSAFAGESVAALPEPSDDDAGRSQALEILALLGAGGWLRPIEAQDQRGACLAREVLAGANPLADAVYAIQALSGTPFLLGDNPDQREAWLPKLLDGTAMGAFAMSEAEAGSDVASMTTTAVRDNGGYVLNGTKTLISNAGIADVYVVFASTDPERGSRGISAFVVPAETEGFEYVKPLVMSSPHPLGDVAFRGCRLPEAARLGAEGDGFKLGMATLDRIRPTVAAAACGMASRALDEGRSTRALTPPIRPASFRLPARPAEARAHGHGPHRGPTTDLSGGMGEGWRRRAHHGGGRNGQSLRHGGRAEHRGRCHPDHGWARRAGGCDGGPPVPIRPSPSHL